MMNSNQENRDSAGPGYTAAQAPNSGPHNESTINNIAQILPHNRVFPIQIGDELFKLSGASLSFDAPSYFTRYFARQIELATESGEDLSTAIKTLYIDRDPNTFRDIAMHMQGYHVKPRDSTHFVRLFLDAQFYSLPRFISQLYEENIFVSIGDREFQIPRDVFNDPGNTPNYFSLGFTIFFSKPDDLFPGLRREGLLRPPSIQGPSVPNRDADIFSDLLRLLRGYPVRIRNEEHRQDLLRDARYFHFKGIEQKIIAHHISHNLARGREEIVLRIENIQKSGISVETGREPGDSLAGYVNYARPFVDDHSRELILEIGGEATKIHFSAGMARAEFFRDTKARVSRLFEVISTKLNLPPTTQPLGLLMASGGASSQPATPGNTPLSEDLVRVVFEPESAIMLDGKPFHDDPLPPITPGAVDYPSASAADSGAITPMNPRKRRRADDGTSVGEEWTVKRGQWRLRIRSTRGGKAAVECVLVAVKLEAESSEAARNFARGFLSD
ncbi:hypothetical protein NLU13_3374 [Sarocladium strictum]|uniref:BTB/POZ domain-containing protein n=1 Tax=Sarocladium strictum TaxID=5046 RepID=A0AA39GMM0_SARSR|nr:hypothetical protein NLU13_3374 [Sarocladium strictum]